MKKPSVSGYKSIAGFGVDVASHRADDLDKLCLSDLKTKNAPKVLDLGAGLGGQSVRMAQIGAQVTAVDVYDFEHEYHKLRAQNGLAASQLVFIQCEIQHLSKITQLDIYSDVLFQRTLHYLPYEQAVELLQFLTEIVIDKMYISVTGLDSAIGENYAGKSVPIADRFFLLTPEQSKTFSIAQPVCLYTKNELVDLLEKTGWKVDSCWESAFGNIKAVCTH
jgi:SAM-dependent methyltransferase